MLDKPTLKNLTTNFGKPPDQQNKILLTLGTPHIESFNYMLDDGFRQVSENIIPVEFNLNKVLVSLSIKEIALLSPMVPSSELGVKTGEIWPSECRQSATSYSGKLIVKLGWSLDGEEQKPLCKDLGTIPVMIKSKACHLSNLSPEELIKRNEHAEEWGGYFVVKGKERIVRMLLMTRRNYPTAVKRPAWKQAGELYSDLGIMIRCVRNDHTALVNVLHYVTDGTVQVNVSHYRRPYYIPLMIIIKCLVDYNDAQIFNAFMEGYEEDQYMKGCIKNMLRDLHKNNCHSRSDVRNYVGSRFTVVFRDSFPTYTHDDICEYILKHCVCIHLDDYLDKFRCLVMMTQKLFCVVNGKSSIEGVDAIMMQELLLGGHLYQQVIKEKIQVWLLFLKMLILKKENTDFVLSPEEMKNILRKSMCMDSAIQNFLSTGNIASRTGLGLQQTSGFVVMAENINRMRYMSHFRAVHRGAFFKEMRSSEPRKLLPDAWGFICPVHTPDGAPCGLLNHITKDCQVTTEVSGELMRKLPDILDSLGLHSISGIQCLPARNCYLVMLDGRAIGRVPDNLVSVFVDKLRMLKIKGEKVPKTLEIVLVPKKETRGQHPGVFLFSGPARMMRPVLNLAARQVELIGTFEQIYMDICVTPEEIYNGVTTHQELSKTSFLSNLASLIPMPDCNQSPRNMYQCQMGKQTMGTPCHTWQFLSENKLYRLIMPATPLFRPLHYDLIGMDEFAMGVNAFVAVISYTGYDMEDAMIINKASLERGLAHGSISKTEIIELQHKNSYFGIDPGKVELLETLGEDGLPFPGAKISKGQPFYCFFDYTVSKFTVHLFHSEEEALIENVKLCGVFAKSRLAGVCKAFITYRTPRNPTVGDKFASRAGQKGIFSFAWPAEDIPFTESGMVPDIIFNPHGFPSRMTIAMMIESMAGKSAALHGLVHDATPFEFSEECSAIDYFGKCLQIGGFNYYGTERLYSGITGRELTANIFCGIVHYQRLRHMVSDKWQVRSVGPVDVLTRQPVQGRQRGGGVRFGEMERDALISHGAPYLLQDRLFHCSDKHLALVCRTCGSLIAPSLIDNPRQQRPKEEKILVGLECLLCKKEGKVQKIEIPYITRLLAVQLASVGIHLKLNFKD